MLLEIASGIYTILALPLALYCFMNFLASFGLASVGVRRQQYHRHLWRPPALMVISAAICIFVFSPYSFAMMNEDANNRVTCFMLGTLLFFGSVFWETTRRPLLGFSYHFLKVELAVPEAANG